MSSRVTINFGKLRERPHRGTEFRRVNKEKVITVGRVSIDCIVTISIVEIVAVVIIKFNFR